MAFQQRAPHPALAGLILSYWRLTGLNPNRLYSAVPKRHIELVINVGAPQLAGAEKLVQTPFESCWLTGFRMAPIYILPTGACTLYGVRFRDFAVPSWLCDQFRPTPGWSTDLGSAQTAQEVAAYVRGCRDLDDASAKLNAFFFARAGVADRLPMLAHAVQRAENRDVLSPANVFRSFNGPARDARQQAKAQGGLTLRRFARLSRFDRALIRLGNGCSDKIAEIAVDVGYYDEAHMAHDFASFCGVPPAVFKKARESQRQSELPHHMIACD